MTRFDFTSHKALRAEFWRQHPTHKRNRGKPHNLQPCDTRCAFIDFVDAMERNGRISSNLAQRATLIG